MGTPQHRGEGGTQCLPALAATEGQRNAWKLEAQSSLTVPMLRGSHAGCHQLQEGKAGTVRQEQTEARQVHVAEQWAPQY